jgi:predicted DNA-binding protein
MKNEIIIIRVDKTMKEEIEKLAKASRRTTSDYLRILIEDKINYENNNL